eukprot:9288498-Prorocentrum_lima.AAC.1
MAAGPYSMTPHPCPEGWKPKTAGMDWLFHGEVRLHHDVVTSPAEGTYPSAIHFYCACAYAWCAGGIMSQGDLDRVVILRTPLTTTAILFPFTHPDAPHPA